LIEGIKRFRPDYDYFELMIWCEYPGHYHAVPETLLEIEQPKEWFIRVSPYARAVSLALRPFLRAALVIGAIVLTKEQRMRAERHLRLLEAIEPPRGARGESTDPAVNVGHPPQPASGPALRAFRELLMALAPGGYHPNLEQVALPSGDILWLCSLHAEEFKPRPIDLGGIA
jgi:hypothetical protein